MKSFMKKVIFFLFIIPCSLFADEGMWLPYLLKQMNEADMKKNGCKLSAEDIYSVNKSSLKDAIVQFGGGCTGEIISDKGLLLTNHHCGYSQVASHSSVQKDYLTNGFWAMNQSEELTNPGLTATFIIRIEDVTKQILEGIPSGANSSVTDSIMAVNKKRIEKNAVQGTHFESFIRPFYYGNMYILFVTEVFKDVRLVGAPPSFIGKFGGDTDNWAWPRHTGDFSIFRIYAGKDNKPAEYSPENIPYVPRKSLSISLKGVKENDFTMVYGFPGRTQEYLFSDAVKMTMNESDPVKVALREKRLGIMQQFMKADDATRIAFAANYASIANYWKKWMGEMNGLRKSDAVKIKMEYQKKLLTLTEKDPIKQDEFKRLFSEFEKAYTEFSYLGKQIDYYSECLMGIYTLSYAGTFEKIVSQIKSYKSGKGPEPKAELEKTKNEAVKYHKSFNFQMDKALFVSMIEMYATGMAKNERVPFLDSLLTIHKTSEALANSIYGNSAFVNAEKLQNLISNMGDNPVLMEADPMYSLASSILTYYGKNVRPAYLTLDSKILALNKQYMRLMMEVDSKRRFYPDANSTLRLAYGKVKPYKPRDGVQYNWFTTLDGMMEKENPLNDEFIIFPKLKELYQKKEYGKYADVDGKIHISFIASNHTTGGNSGSPVLNANGELIGTNYDRVWEGTMSDIMFNPDICRNIVLDVRYTLFVIDKYAGAGYLLNEMKIVQ